MELVLKLPKDKLPFIGIIFERSYEASYTNYQCVNDPKFTEFFLVIEPDGLNIRLASSEPFFHYQYSQIKYDPEKLKKWLLQTRSCTQFNFSHLIKNFDELEVVRTPEKRKLYVLKIHRIQISD